MEVVTDIDFADLLGHLISDNIASNDVAVEELCELLGPNNANTGRLRCIEYVISLSARAFLGGNDKSSIDSSLPQLQAPGSRRFGLFGGVRKASPPSAVREDTAAYNLADMS
jgi:hypothetical protein